MTKSASKTRSKMRSKSSYPTSTRGLSDSESYWRWTR